MLRKIVSPGSTILPLSQQPGLAELPNGATVGPHAELFGPVITLQWLKDTVLFARAKALPVYAINLNTMIVLSLCPPAVVEGVEARNFLAGMPIAIDGFQLLRFVQKKEEQAREEGKELADMDLGDLHRFKHTEYPQGEGIETANLEQQKARGLALIVEILDAGILSDQHGNAQVCFYGLDAEVLAVGGDGTCLVTERASGARLAVARSKLWRRESFIVMSSVSTLGADPTNGRLFPNVRMYACTYACMPVWMYV